MDKREIKSIIEGLLFIWGEPLLASDITEVLDIKENEVHLILKEMMNDFNYNRRGLQIKQTNNSYQLTTRAEHFDWISKLCTPRNDKKLSNAALETLSIIAYKQPITRMEVEALRGVKCDRSINTLVQKELVKEVGRLDKTGRPILYGTTDDFLQYFGLTSLEQLPQLEDFTKLDEDGQLELEFD
ncbi:SMC-Scp complex subunit ScpB [Sporosalibacterium faouarense]|uniref:SMC-Scp complex subunit ScpB n=1 Tax=Sporosalibacterium faouarense TaxID=516123 RepID=UPI00141C9F1E|nr:SMC-Scp complex subunit ScpB [Sporosalibacterium faouarense]MTI48166.1 SMC-Scp complex subunit ScpB [Bacillota bacterium]